VTALLSVAVATLGNGGTDPTLHEIAGYRQWTRVHEKPLPIENSIVSGGA
jgi:hypothetical protein